MGSEWICERERDSNTLTPNPSPKGRREQYTSKPREQFISLSLWEWAGVRVLESGTNPKRESQKLDAVIRKNLEVLGYGE